MIQLGARERRSAGLTEHYCFLLVSCKVLFVVCLCGLVVSVCVVFAGVFVCCGLWLFYLVLGCVVRLVGCGCVLVCGFCWYIRVAWLSVLVMVCLRCSCLLFVRCLSSRLCVSL